MNSGKVVLGVLFGVAAGTLMGILFAPEKGSVTRKNILNKGGDYADAWKEKLNEVVNNVVSKFESTWKEAENMAMKAKGKSEDTKSE
ncbi:hypothetical protein AD998_20865 [bacterium 336/3]|jgi:gas vesicle protein|nr:hypothetical protein AD998_20865 [bacterium 336/3]